MLDEFSLPPTCGPCGISTHRGIGAGCQVSWPGGLRADEGMLRAPRCWCGPACQALRTSLLSPAAELTCSLLSGTLKSLPNLKFGFCNYKKSGGFGSCGAWAWEAGRCLAQPHESPGRGEDLDRESEDWVLSSPLWFKSHRVWGHWLPVAGTGCLRMWNEWESPFLSPSRVAVQTWSMKA